MKEGRVKAVALEGVDDLIPILVPGSCAGQAAQGSSAEVARWTEEEEWNRGWLRWSAERLCLCRDGRSDSKMEQELRGKDIRRSDGVDALTKEASKVSLGVWGEMRRWLRSDGAYAGMKEFSKLKLEAGEERWLDGLQASTARESHVLFCGFSMAKAGTYIGLNKSAL